MITDGELLRRYAKTHSEDAFEELVRRNLNLVYSAALRQVNGDAHLAQDVTQTVFTDLARKAALLSRRAVLTGWLYTSTHFAAAKATRSEHRRHAREQEAHTMRELLYESAPDLDWQKLRPVLDAAMHELKESDRDAILLRYFENRALADVGAKLGVSENAARMRVERAVEKLRTLLARRGIASAAAALATILSSNAVQLAPVGLAATVTTASLAGGVGTGVTVTILKLMTMNKLATGIIGAVIVASVATPLAVQHREQARLRNENATLRTTAEQVAQLVAENQRLSNLLAQSREPNETLNELLRLRNEVGMLRQQTNDLARLRQENNTLRASVADLAHRTQPTADPNAEQFRKQVSIPKMNDSRALSHGCIRYAEEHGNLLPTNFDLIVPYLTGDLTLSGTNSFEMVYNGSLSALTNVSSVILLRESNPWQFPDGKWAKVYGFADGHSELHGAPDGNFDEFERQHMPPRATTQLNPSD